MGTEGAAMIWRIDGGHSVQVAAGTVAAAAATAGWTLDGVLVNYVGVPLATVLMAFAGAVVSLTWMKTERAWWAVVGAGTLIGAACSPLVAEVAFQPERALLVQKAIAFALGLGVQVAVPAFFEWIKNRGQQ